ncbi:MAG: hypothetical protein KGJ02_06115 [Verrucomicrobiota bacterium]|nr:hypothetical protein [Verrucomicrobiota bacterium]
MSRSFILIIGIVFLRGQELFPLDMERIEKHVREKFSEAVIETRPFPHLIIENILPEELYEELVANWPGHTVKDIENDLGNYDKKLWQEFFTSVMNNLIKRNIGAMFRRYLRYRFEDDICWISLCNSKHLRDHTLYESLYILPHLDHASTFAAVIIYFPEKNNQINFGTQFYRHKEEKTSIDIIWEHDLSKMELLKIVPFKRNTLCAFMQTPCAWHGFPMKVLPRRMYMSNIYVSNAFSEQYYGHAWHLEEGYLDEEHSY